MTDLRLLLRAMASYQTLASAWFVHVMSHDVPSKAPFPSKPPGVFSFQVHRAKYQTRDRSAVAVHSIPTARQSASAPRYSPDVRDPVLILW